jgi:hypothetical protein
MSFAPEVVIAWGNPLPSRLEAGYDRVSVLVVRPVFAPHSIARGLLTGCRPDYFHKVAPNEFC